VDGPVDLVAAFRAHEARVFNYFRRMGAGRDSARDLSQETFLRAIQGARRFRGEAPVEVWLLGIARNVYREWLRRRVPDPATGEDDGVAEGPGPERLDVARALLALEPSHREVLVLRFVLDLSGEEVAQLLGIGHDAVRQRVARAKAEFRRVWRGEV
jgi:RNA polymerase sigma-70 factor (ECF subfamily)